MPGGGEVPEVPQARAGQQETAHWDASGTLEETAHGGVLLRRLMGVSDT